MPKRREKKSPGDDLLSHQWTGSIIGAGGLNFRVRNGIGWNPSAVVTRTKYMIITMNFDLSAGGVPHRGRSLYVNSSTPVNQKFGFYENFLRRLFYFSLSIRNY
jgi:hypothetical protein